ncbi:phospholipase D family protein [Bacillus sp. NTK071]|uniref:phospholipase D family protein n=1 Tax=Bacillus sp. NTK071 TaxID=2802175 RepID=UPI001A90922A|nr:phospholipase D family protein [Bacillus sp. NTK071]MBN8208828.1 phospholipase D family protein [Bacillus sp. NTK071]
MKKRHWYQKKRWIVLSIFLLIYVGVMTYHRFKPLPEGVSYAGEVHNLNNNDIEFLYDLTYDKNGKEVYDHSIFDEINQTIMEADDFLILDLFLFNGYTDGKRDYPKISEDLSKAVVKKMKENPDLEVVLISDEVNTTYGSHQAKQIQRIKDMGAEVIYTDLNRLRDPNLFYSGIWRMTLSWFGQDGFGWLPNPMAPSAPKVTMRSYLELLNVKANHRKTVVTEDAGIVMSANPHDASGFHSNIAFKVKGPILNDLIQSEKAVASYSGGDLSRFPDETIPETEPDDTSNIQAQIVTESKIQDSVVTAIDDAKKGNMIYIGMFYLADRDIVDALVDAADREVDVRLVLDPNQNAFGQQKIGLPNLPVTAELHKQDKEHLSVRWYDTNKEQFHTKLLYVKGKNESTIVGGSGNYTSRNMDDYNMETNIHLKAPNESEVVKNVDSYFERIWSNEDGVYTVGYEEYQDSLPAIKYVMYILQKIFQVTTY